MRKVTQQAIRKAAESIRQGRLAAFPTETVYGLGANALDAGAVARIFTAKGRPSTSPLIVHVASVESARDLASEWPEAAAILARYSRAKDAPEVDVRITADTDGSENVVTVVPATPEAATEKLI